MKILSKIKQQRRIRRHKRIRSKVKGSESRPRLSIFKSNKYIYAQVIDDISGATLTQARDLSEQEIKKVGVKDFKGKTAAAYKVGRLIAKRALEKGINQVVFDRGGYKYYGRIKAFAEGARKGGLKF